MGKTLVLLALILLVLVEGCGKVDVQRKQQPHGHNSWRQYVRHQVRQRLPGSSFCMEPSMRGSPSAGIAGATVTVTSDPVTTTTNSNGYYEVVVDPGTHTIAVSKSGYDTNAEQFTASSGGVMRNRIGLSKPV